MAERFALGKVLGTGVRVWGANVVPFLVVTTLVFTPLFAWAIWFATSPPFAETGRAFRYSTLGLKIVLDTAVEAPLTYGVVMELLGKRASMVAYVRTGLARFLPALAVAVVTNLLFFAGLALLIVPGVVLLCMLFVTVPASVIERPGVFGAIKRSSELTRGHRVAIFGLAILTFGVAFTTRRLVALVFDASASELAKLAIAIPTTSLFATLNAVAYYYLRQEKEGTSAAELAKVFE
jgi:hypothetical protein